MGTDLYQMERDGARIGPDGKFVTGPESAEAARERLMKQAHADYDAYVEGIGAYFQANPDLVPLRITREAFVDAHVAGRLSQHVHDLVANGRRIMEDAGPATVPLHPDEAAARRERRQRRRRDRRVQQLAAALRDAGFAKLEMRHPSGGSITYGTPEEAAHVILRADERHANA